MTDEKRTGDEYPDRNGREVITVRPPFSAEQLAEHYHDNPDVRSVPDALREAGREIVNESQ